MATFMATLRFTEQGARAIGESTKRAAAFKATAKKLGVKVTAQDWTLGAVDGVMIADAPDDAAMTAAMLALAGEGNVRTTTARAFDAAEFAKLIGGGKK